LCQDELRKFEKADFNKKYNDVTWKNNEHISEIWREYYQCENNNQDAKVLFDIHKSLLARGIYPSEYLYQEFDYIRSAFPPHLRKAYISMRRRGRAINFDEKYRTKILEGLACWEDKMNFVGIVDYIGLATALYQHLDDIKPKYRCILIDEVQDFGKIELEIIRQLVEPGENDLFLCGDHAQQVYTKYHNPIEAGISISGRSNIIRKNYRNSREILQAAYNLFYNNLGMDMVDDELLDGVLDPEYANFSSPLPLILFSPTLPEEFAFCFNYINYMIEGSNEKTCIALCGYSLLEVKKIGEEINLPVLDGSISIDDGNIFLSDLEQTKGFEFDRICIINCTAGTIPKSGTPPEEYYRELCKLYVTMTRAKRELIISYSSKISPFFGENNQDFQYSRWDAHEKNNRINEFELPMPSGQIFYRKSLLDKTGEKFLYCREALGIPTEVQNKMLERITGVNKMQGRKILEWASIRKALADKTNRLYLVQAFGQKTFQDFETFFNRF